MKTCTIENRQLRDLIEYNLPEPKEVQLLEHLRNCRSCQYEVGAIFDSGPGESVLTDSEIVRIKNRIKLLVEKENRNRTTL